MSPLLSRVCLCIALLGSLPAQAQPNVSPAVRRWISAVVTGIGEAERRATSPRPRVRAGAVELRLRVAADGSLRDAQIDRSSGSAALDERALAAARAAAPFGPPPRALLTPDGTTELSFPIEMTAAR